MDHSLSSRVSATVKRSGPMTPPLNVVRSLISASEKLIFLIAAKASITAVGFPVGLRWDHSPLSVGRWSQASPEDVAVRRREEPVKQPGVDWKVRDSSVAGQLVSVVRRRSRGRRMVGGEIGGLSGNGSFSRPYRVPVVGGGCARAARVPRLPFAVLFRPFRPGRRWWLGRGGGGGLGRRSGEEVATVKPPDGAERPSLPLGLGRGGGGALKRTSGGEVATVESPDGAERPSPTVEAGGRALRVGR